MAQTISTSQFDAAIAAAQADGASPADKAEMLMEIAMGLQLRPKTSEQLHQAIQLYAQALSTCPAEAPLLAARIEARRGTALQALSEGGFESLYNAQASYERALPVLKEKGRPEEAAEVEMNLGLTLQSLSSLGRARLSDAIQCYHRSLRVFVRETYPREYVILHNNLAIAYLSIPLSDERAKMREALAVQSFEEVLKVINLIDHPSEYAMIQNNLGNALQYASSGHRLENNLRALDAYDEALKVRNRRDTPLEYANTLANKANVLRNLPDDDGAPMVRRHAEEARRLYVEARQIFQTYQQSGSATIVNEALADLDAQLGSMRQPRPSIAADGARS